MPLNFLTKRSKKQMKNIDVGKAKLPREYKVHAFDVHISKHHGTPHVHLSDGTVLNVFSGKLFKKDKQVGSIKKKELNRIRVSIIGHIMSVSEGKFNFDGNMAFVHTDMSDPYPSKPHVHIHGKTFSADRKIYSIGTSNEKLKNLHNKLDTDKNPDLVLENLKSLYSNSKHNSSMPDSLRNKLKILVDTCDVSREYIKKNMVLILNHMILIIFNLFYLITP